MIAGCYLVGGRQTILYNYLTVLLFELGQSRFVFHARPHSPSLIAIVVLTIGKGYKDCTLSPVLTRSRP